MDGNAKKCSLKATKKSKPLRKALRNKDKKINVLYIARQHMTLGGSRFVREHFRG